MTPELASGLRETIEALAAYERAPNSPGERRAAGWIAERLTTLGCEVAIDEERSHPSYARPIAALSGAGTLAGLAALVRPGRAPAVLAAAVTAAIADDISNGPRLFRRATMASRPTWNVVARCGDRDAPRTVVVLAHHDAAPTGRIFDQRFHHWLARAFPGLLARRDTALPLWWPVVGGPLAVAAGAATGRRGLTALGAVLGAGSTLSFLDIARSAIVPGASDNLSGVAVLVALAEAFAESPPAGVRVLLVSCGSEEIFQGGIRGFAKRHFPSLDRESTWFVNHDTVGGPQLVMLEGEGPLVMEDYWFRPFRDLVEREAVAQGVPLMRGMRARSSTDSVIPSRARFPTATLTSLDRDKALTNYHLPSDVPENVDYGTVAQAVALTAAVIRRLGQA